MLPQTDAPGPRMPGEADPLEDCRDQIRALHQNCEDLKARLSGTGGEIESTKQKIAQKKLELVTSVNAVAREKAKREKKNVSHEVLRGRGRLFVGSAGRGGW